MKPLLKIVGLPLALLCLAGCASPSQNPSASSTQPLAMHPATAPASAVTVLNDLSYKSGPGLSDYERQRCKLDLFLPKGKAFATVVWFYGGGLESGEKTRAWHRDIAMTLARHGIACALPDYRLSPKATYPAYVDDAAASVAWVLHHIGQYGGDPNRVFISGHSAGAYLATMVGFAPQFLARHGASTRQIAGLLPVSPQVFTHFTIRKERGVPDPQHTPVIDDAAPAHYVRPDAPPILIFVADKDMPTRREECRYFIAMLESMKHPDAHMRVIAGRNHGTVAKKIVNPADPTFQAMLAFIAAHSAKP